MDAKAFWKNYKAAHEWQKRHNVTWWKTKCFALENENYLLKETIRNLVQKHNCDYNLNCNSNQNASLSQEDTAELNSYLDENNISGNFQFYLNDGMMDFLEQSIRHKIELKNKRKSEDAVEESQNNNKQTIESITSRTRKRSENAKLLYGDASSKILAMEIALQTSVERHTNKLKPPFWPNIPLKL